MAILFFKVLVTPLLIWLVTLASRRWGHAVGGWLVALPLTAGPVGGWLVALPLTAGPVVLFDSIENGSQFGVRAATGCLAGTVALIGFSLAYAAVAERAGWFSALAIGLAAYATIGVAVAHTARSGVLLFFVIVCTLPLALHFVPSHSVASTAAIPSRWDLPFRVITATTLVLALTGGARILGPALSGLLASLPVYAGTLTAFAHRAHGGRAAISMIRGVLFGLFGYAAFFLALVLLLPRFTLAVAFTTSCVVNFAVQGCSLYIITRQRAPVPRRA
jgi:hypothetical protein